jgi:hypothetical protein
LKKRYEKNFDEGDEKMKKMIIVAFVMALCATTQAGVNYAVLFSGGVEPDMNYNYYYNDTLRMWNIMTGTLGYDPANVYVLFADSNWCW